MRRPGSEDPHRRERNFFINFSFSFSHVVKIGSSLFFCLLVWFLKCFLPKTSIQACLEMALKVFFQREPYKSRGLFCYAHSLQILAKTSACERAELSNCTCFLYISSSWNEIRRKVCCTERRKKKILVS